MDKENLSHSVEKEASRPGSFSKSRIASFSDSVFSIILTLLVFSFHIPEVKTGQDVDLVIYEKMLKMHDTILCYALTFVLVTMFWIEHHNLFSQLRHSNRGLLWCNALFLMFLAFMPYPASVLGTFPNSEAAATLFGIGMVLSLLSFTFLRYYCFYVADLVEEEFSPEERVKSVRRGVMGVLIYTAGIAFAVVNEDVTLSVYLLLPFLYFIKHR